MTNTRIALTLLLCACGRVVDEDGGLPDAAHDTAMEAQTTCTSGSFGNVIALDTLNTSADERGLRLSSDGLRALFSRGHHGEAGVSQDTDIFGTSRVDLKASFGAPTDLVVSPGNIIKVGLGVVYPTFSDDDVSIFFESLCESTEPVYISHLCHAAVDSGTQAVPNSANSAELAANVGPFGAGWSYGDGLVVNGKYYFAAVKPDAGASDAIFVTLLGTSTLPDLVFESSSGEFVDNPVVTPDELTMFYSATTAGIAHIKVATRTSKSAPFVSSDALSELDSSEGEYPTWISNDRCTLYFTRTVGGQMDMFAASRLP